MLRLFLTTSFLAVFTVMGHAQGAAPAQQVPPATAPGQPSGPDQVAPDDPVISVHGICPPGATNQNPDSCTTVITKRQFDALLTAMNIGNQYYSPAALRSIAESYVQLMALADAGQKAGIDKDPRFEEMLRVVHVRTLAEAYRRSLDEKFNNPPPQVIEDYYTQNLAKYEQLKLDRVFIPLADPKRPQERQTFERKARLLANDMRERAAKGEDMNSLEAEAYRTLGLEKPPATDLGAKRKGNLPSAVEKDVFVLKPGEVTKVETDLAGFSFYKLRAREPVPLQFVKNEIIRDLYQKNMEAAVKSVTGRVHSDFNENFFKPRANAPKQPFPVPARMVPPGGFATPPGAGAPRPNVPPPTGRTAPAGNSSPAPSPTPK